MRGPRRLFASSMALTITFCAASAFADRALVLPLAGAGVSKAELDDSAARFREGARDVGHTLPTDAEQKAAEATIKDGIADTRDEHVAAGKAANVDWSIGGRIESRGHYVRVEIEACQVATGRVESLARNMVHGEERKKSAEMLALLLRKEGITNAVVPWANEVPPEPKPVTPPPTPPPEKPAPPPPPPPEPVGPMPRYAEDKPFAIGVGAGALAAVSRPSNASGSATTATIMGSFGYALDAVPGLELRAEVGGGVVSPRSVFVGAGGRYAFMVLRKPRLYLGPEVQLGGFIPVGGDKKGRFLVRGGPVVGVALVPAFAVELFGDFGVAPGGTGALVLAGGGARGVVRF